jgi:mono/diheme cytochrome c family protein
VNRVIAILLALFGVHSWGGHHAPAALNDGGLVVTVAPAAAPLVADGCLACHVHSGAGSRNLGAPNLTHEGRKHRGIDWQIRHLRCPSCVVPGSPMPSFKALSAAQLRRLAGILEASK